MPVKAFALSAIDARRLAKPGQRFPNLRIDHNSTVTLITEIGEKEANIDFRFTANYRATEEVVGLIRIEGSLLWDTRGRELAKQWSSTNQMPNEIASEIHTMIMTICVPETVLLARDLQLPPPIPIPQVNVGMPPPPKHPGPEVA